MLAFEGLTGPCKCRRGDFGASKDRADPPCDYGPGDDATALAALRVEVVAEPAAVAPGKPVRIVTRYRNTSAEPLRVLLDRDPHEDFPGLVDAASKEVPQETDRSCREVSTLGMASFSLVVLEPNGVIEHTSRWSANRTRRVADGALGCHSTPGSPLAKGKYTLRSSSYRVWELRDRRLEVGVEVR